jgi:ubiquinone biosynthesis protein UbiJ
VSGPAHGAAEAGAGLAVIFTPPVTAAINHLLRSASWACERLKPFCGKTVQFTLAPFSVVLAIRENGEVSDAAAGPRDTTAGFASNESARPCDAAFTLTPGVALRVLASDQNAWRDVQMSGDTELAREILFVAQNLRWDAEEDLSRVFGDIIAHRMVQAASDLKHWRQQATDSIARSAVAYWTDEQPLIATRHDVERFVGEVDALRDDVARLEKRIEQLTARDDRR